MPLINALQAMGGSNQSMSVPSSSMAGSSPELSADLPALLGSLDGGGGGYADGGGNGSGLPPAAILQQQAAMAAAAAASATGASIYIKGMPEEADKLWLYEKFARWAGGRADGRSWQGGMLSGRHAVPSYRVGLRVGCTVPARPPLSKHRNFIHVVSPWMHRLPSRP